MAVLYRTYRPQKFSEVVGQAHVVRTLQNQVSSGQPAHAYLFTGGRGVGKTSIARILAKALNCLKPEDGDACGSCSLCEQVQAGTFMDLTEVDAASNTGVDNVRELIEHVRFAPSQGKYKVFIIDEVHMLSKGAFNALLKTLEEPPSSAIFILATTETSKVPATVISRTQRFDFRQISEEAIESQVVSVAKQEKLELEPDVARLIARLAAGGLRDALSLLGKVASLGGGAPLVEVQQLLGVTDLSWSVELLGTSLAGRANDLPELFSRATAAGVDPLSWCRSSLELSGELLEYRLAGVRQPSALATLDTLETWAALVGPAGVISAARLLLRAYKDIPGAPEGYLPLLLAAAEICTSISSALPKPPAGGVATIAAAVPVPVSAPVVESVSTTVQVSAAVVPVTLVAPEPESSLQPDVSLLFSEVQVVWPSAVVKLTGQNAPLGNLLRRAELLEVDGGHVVIGVKFSFHKQNVEQSKNRELISGVLSEALGRSVGLKVQLVKETPVAVGDGGAVAAALQVFGGELVE